MLPKNRRPTHPGEIIRFEFLEPLNMTQQELAEALGVARTRLTEIILGKRALTPDVAFRLAKLFNTTAEFWMGLQTNLDMWEAFQANKAAYLRINPLRKKLRPRTSLREEAAAGSM